MALTSVGALAFAVPERETYTDSRSGPGNWSSSRELLKMSRYQLEAGIARVREVLLQLREGMQAHDLIIPARDEVIIGHFGRLFAPDRLESLTAEEFKSFLAFKNNKHWTGLTRHQERMCSDMKRLRAALTLLLDESMRIDKRYTQALDMVPGMGNAIATAILMMVYLDKYGVWNNTSEAALKALGLWPAIERGASRGRKYEEVNAVLNTLADSLELDLWTLDALWWAMLELDRDGGQDDAAVRMDVEQGQRFGLERHLHDFLRDNWEMTELGSEWTLEIEEGEPDSGYEYPTSIGRIDLLAKRRVGKEYMVIELKRGQTSDDTVGQILRYMGWVEAELLEAGETVKGLIIAQQADEKLRYALRRLPDVDLMLYRVDFHLVNDADT